MEENREITVEEQTEELEMQTTFNETSVEELIDDEESVENVSDRCE